MKIKILIILLCFFFGMMQNSIGQEPDSLNVKTDTIVFNFDTIVVDSALNVVDSALNVVDTIFIEKQIDSLKIAYQLKNKELLKIEKQIDSLESLISNQFLVKEPVTYPDTSSLSISNKDTSYYEDEDEDWRKLYGFVFKIEYCKPFKDSLYITARVKYLEGANIVFRIHIQAFETYYQKNILKERENGSKTEVVYLNVSSIDEVFRLRVPLKKQNLGSDSKIIRVKIMMSLTSGSKYEEYLGKSFMPIKNNWQNKHSISF